MSAAHPDPAPGGDPVISAGHRLTVALALEVARLVWDEADTEAWPGAWTAVLYVRSVDAGSAAALGPVSKADLAAIRAGIDRVAPKGDAS